MASSVTWTTGLSERKELLKNQEESARKSKYNETLKALENPRENESPVSGMSDDLSSFSSFDVLVGFTNA